MIDKQQQLQQCHSTQDPNELSHHLLLNKKKSILKPNHIQIVFYTEKEYEQSLQNSKIIFSKIKKSREQLDKLKQIPRCKICDGFLDKKIILPKFHHTKVLFSIDNKAYDEQINEFNIDNYKHIDTHNLDSQDYLCDNCKPKCQKCKDVLPAGYQGSMCHNCKEQIKNQLKATKLKICECGDQFQVQRFGQRQCNPCKQDPERLNNIKSMQNLEQFEIHSEINPQKNINSENSLQKKQRDSIIGLSKKFKSDNMYKSTSLQCLDKNLSLKKHKSMIDLSDQHKMTCIDHSLYYQFKLYKFQAKIEKPKSLDIEYSNYEKTCEKYLNKFMKDFEDTESENEEEEDDDDDSNWGDEHQFSFLQQQQSLDDENSQNKLLMQNQQSSSKDSQSTNHTLTNNNNNSHNINNNDSNNNAQLLYSSNCTNKSNSIILTNNPTNISNSNTSSKSGSFLCASSNKKVRYSKVIEIKCEQFGVQPHSDESSSVGSMKSNDGSDNEDSDCNRSENDSDTEEEQNNNDDLFEDKTYIHNINNNINDKEQIIESDREYLSEDEEYEVVDQQQNQQTKEF